GDLAGDPPGAAGGGCGGAEPAGERDDPGAVLRWRARTGVRDVPRLCGHLDGGGPVAGGGTDRGVGRGGGLAGGGPGGRGGVRGVVLVNVPVGLVTLGLAWRLLPRVRPHGAERWLDLPGLVLLGGTVLVFMLPFVAGQGASSLRWLLVLLSIVGAVVFWRWERRYERSGRRPVFTAGLLGTATYSRGAVFALLYFGGFTSIFLLSTLYLQSGLGLTALQCGLVLTPFALAGAVSAWLSGRWVSRFGRRLVIIGVLAM